VCEALPPGRGFDACWRAWALTDGKTVVRAACGALVVTSRGCYGFGRAPHLGARAVGGSLELAFSAIGRKMVWLGGAVEGTKMKLVATLGRR
jgi:hypothetical protein